MKDPYVIQREAMLHLHEMLAEKEDALIELQAEADKRDNMAMERYAPCLSDDHDYHKEQDE